MAKNNNVHIHASVTDEDSRRIADAYEESMRETTKEGKKTLGLITGASLGLLAVSSLFPDALPAVGRGITNAGKAVIGTGKKVINSFRKKEPDAVDIIVEESK